MSSAMIEQVKREWPIGAELARIVGAPIDRELLARYSEVSGDHNAVHLDPTAARAAGLDDVIAQGMLAMALLARVVTQVASQRALCSLSTRFHRPIRIGDVLTYAAKVAAIEGDFVRMTLSARLADGTDCLSGEAVISLATLTI